MSGFDDHDAAPDEVAVVCSTCRARLHAELREQAYQIECPDCFMPVNVPAGGPAAAGRKREAPQPNGNTYGLSIPAEVVERQQRVESQPEPVTADVDCPRCGARFETKLRARARQVSCPQCYELVDVPATESDLGVPNPRRRKRQRKPQPADPLPESFVADVSVPSPQEHSPEYLQAQQRERPREPIPDPPRLLFFSNVFQFPWRDDALIRWVWLSALAVATGMVLAIILWIVSNMSLIVLVFFVLPAFWLGFWTVSYGSALFVTILEETAAGNDRVHGWPDPNWKEWAGQMMYLSYMVSVCIIPGYFTGKGLVAAGYDAWFWPALWGVTVQLFPLVLMSSLAYGSPWVTLYWPVVRTVPRDLFAWLTAEILCLLVWSVYGCVLYFGWWRGNSPFLTMLAGGPVLASAVVLSGRILGRLGWKITQHDDIIPAEQPAGDRHPAKQRA